jgi:hypothetical protein
MDVKIGIRTYPLVDTLAGTLHPYWPCPPACGPGIPLLKREETGRDLEVNCWCLCCLVHGEFSRIRLWLRSLVSHERLPCSDDHHGHRSRESQRACCFRYLFQSSCFREEMIWWRNMISGPDCVTAVKRRCALYMYCS